MEEVEIFLLPKPNKRVGDSSSYRPLCIIETLGKILERILRDRMEPFIEDICGVHENQIGFRKGRFTVDAIKEVVHVVEKAIEGTRWHFGTKEYCAELKNIVRLSY